MRIKINIDPKSRLVLVKLKRIKKSTKKGLKLAFKDIGIDLKREAKRLIRDKNKTGRIYLKRLPGTNRRIRHRSSAAGEAPASFSGKLAASISAITRNWSYLTFGSNIDTPKGRVLYSKNLELGNPFTNLAKRPFLKWASKLGKGTRGNANTNPGLRL